MQIERQVRAEVATMITLTRRNFIAGSAVIAVAPMVLVRNTRGAESGSGALQGATGQVSAAWKRIEAFYAKNFPEYLKQLNPPASDAEISKLETHIEQKLPPDVAASYRIHNGEPSNRHAGFFFGLPLLSLEEVGAEWGGWKAGLSKDAKTSNEIESTSTPPKHIKRVYRNFGWIPLSHDSSGNHLGVDLDPDSAGKIGQVINFGRDEGDKFVMAPSFAGLLEWMLVQFDKGNWTLRKHDGRNPGTSLLLKKPRNQHFLDAARELFGPK